ncbi:hypothetical protein DCAR_0206051 [Daucus carota subsp. sativus]|uniref:Uncharacterized protein n=1 Tax=Daucus carota subsp. sativus TaxID=79200 RepID=A0A166D090_DAUCS|nr:hypothetical protein DCAR_0206051 [Daucus carota subsp. sativus]
MKNTIEQRKSPHPTTYNCIVANICREGIWQLCEREGRGIDPGGAAAGRRRVEEKKSMEAAVFRPVKAVGLTWGVTVSSAVTTALRHRQQHQRKREEEEKIAAVRGGERDEQVVSRRGAATESRCGERESISGRLCVMVVLGGWWEVNGK